MMGERGGKSFHGALQCVGRHTLGTLFWLIAEEYRTTEPEFDYIVQFLRELDAYNPKDPTALSTPREGTRYVRTRDGIVIETRSAQDYRQIAEKAPDGIVGCEVGRWNWETFLRVSGRLAQKRGWAWLSGSFERSVGWQAEKFYQWSGPNTEQARSWGYPSWINKVIFPGGEDDPEIERLRASQPADYFEERYGGHPVPPAGRVYKEFGYVTHVSELANYKPRFPVEVWIDPGYAGAYVVLAVQLFGDIVNVIDELYVQRLTNAEVINNCQRRSWWKDIAHYGVIDVAGRGHTAERSAIEAWREDASVYLESDLVHILDGIQRVRAFLKHDSVRGRPALLVSPRCPGLVAEMGAGKHPIDGMGAYRYKTDSAGTVVSEKPLDKDNHACSALAYGLVARFGLVKQQWSGPANWASPGTGHERFNWRSRGQEQSFEDQAAEFLRNQARRKVDEVR